MTDSRYERGVATQRAFDPSMPAALHAQLDAVAPGFAETTISVAFGDIASRPGLDLRLRALVVLSALAALGADRQLRVWMRFALAQGLAPEELVEAVIQLAPYAGWPRALDALRAAEDVLAAQAP